MSAEEEIVMIVCIYDKKLKSREKKKKQLNFHREANGTSSLE